MQSIDPGHEGPTALNSTADVSICAAPASGKRRQVVAIRVTNLDTSAVVPILQIDVSGTKTEIDRVPFLPAGATDSSLATRERPIHLAATTQSLYMKLAGAVAANQPKVEVEFLESTD
jgi:hypothetical protein